MNKNEFFLLLLSLFQTIGSQAQSIQGTVVDSLSRDPLSYATIALYDSIGERISLILPNGEGYFWLENPANARLFQIEFPGYQKYQQPVHGSQDYNLGAVMLSLNEHILGEVLVKGENVTHKVDRDVYTITNAMRKDAMNAAQMLGNIHGIDYDVLSNSIRVNNQNQILLLVNGIERSQEYINNMNPNRFKQVEIIQNPTGRYASEGYAAIVNLILKENYEGWDLLLQNYFEVNLAGRNGNTPINAELPSFDFTYTKNNWNVNTGYKYIHGNLNYFSSFQNFYTGILKEEVVNTGEPNYTLRSNDHSVYMGVDYELHKNHSLSFEGHADFSHSKSEENYTLHQIDYLQNSICSNQVVNGKNENRNYIAAFFYRGKVGDWSLYSDFNYNYYISDRIYDYKKSSGYEVNNSYHDTKKYTRFNAEATYQFTDQKSINFGYSNTWKGYQTEDLETCRLLSYSDYYRNRIYGYFTSQFGSKINLRLGGGIEYIQMSNEGSKSNYWAFFPDFSVNYKLSKKINLRFLYNTSIDYPNLEQTTPYGYYTDSLMWAVGNPFLEQSQFHTIRFTGTFADRFTIIPAIRFSANKISTFYAQEEERVKKSYVNANFKLYELTAIYTQPIYKSLKLRISASMWRNEIRYNEYRSTLDGLTGRGTLEYEISPIQLHTQLMYVRDMGKNIEIQGRRSSNCDIWGVVLFRNFFKNRLSVMAIYMLPIDWGVEKTIGSTIETPFYSHYSQRNMYYWMYQKVNLRISYRLNGGKRTRDYSNSVTSEKE